MQSTAEIDMCVLVSLQMVDTLWKHFDIFVSDHS